MAQFSTQLGYLNAEFYGAGPAVYWIHAFPLSGKLWAPQYEGGVIGFTHVVPDLPGLGTNDPVVEPYTMEEAAKAIVAILDDHRVRSCAFVGMSMGGYVLMALMDVRPELVGAAVFCSTRATADTDEGKANREKFAKAVTKEGSEYAMREMMPRLVAESAPEDVKKDVKRMIMFNNPAGIAAAQRAMATRKDSRELLAEFDIPVLAVAGELDELIPPAQTKAIADVMPEARFVTIPGAAHLPNIEKPDEFNIVVGEFLRKHAPRKGR